MSLTPTNRKPPEDKLEQDKMAAEPILITNLTQEWVASLRRWHLELFFIPTTVVTLATMLVNPPLAANSSVCVPCMA